MALRAWAVVVAAAIMVLSAALAETDLPEDAAAGVLRRQIDDSDHKAAHLSWVDSDEVAETELVQQFNLGFEVKAHPTVQLTQLPSDVFREPEVLAQEHANKKQIHKEVDKCIRGAVASVVAPTVQRALVQALKSGRDHSFSPAQLLQTAQATVRSAASAIKGKVSISLVESAAKREAIKVAKARGKAAAKHAARLGLSAVAQADAARTMASRVAVMFAEIAHKIGMKVARDELAKQQEDALKMCEQQVNKMAPALQEVNSMVKTRKGDAAAKISATASKGVHSGVKKTKAVAEREAKKAHLSAAQTRKLMKEAPLAVKRAAHALPPVKSAGFSYSASRSHGAGAGAAAEAADVKLRHRISLEKAADLAKEKAKKRVLRHYQKRAVQEKERVRRGLENAAKTQRRATKFVTTVSANSLARGLDKKLSTQNLRLAAKKATHASITYEKAVKYAVRKAINEKKRLKKANEMVAKAGADARKEAHRKNNRARLRVERLSKARKLAEKKRAQELKEKRQRANEAAHKAISRVVEVAAKRAARRAARINAANVQKTYLAEACHRRAQHKLRTIAARAKASGKDPAAAIKANKKMVISDIVVGSVRRNAHMAAVAARRAAAARGMASQMQLNAARRAWKAASPKIKSFCFPAATKAAEAAVKNPGLAPVKINQRKFVDQCLTSTRQAVATACQQATKPVVLDGAKKAAKHDADYKWQVMMGMKEAKRVCSAAIQLYSRNAAVKCNEMVKRTFNESAASKRASMAFMKELRTKAKGNIHVKGEKASKRTVELLHKKCKAEATRQAAHAERSAARKVVHDAALGKSEAAGKAASNAAYSRAIRDGLGVAHAKRLAKEAYDRAKVKALNEASTALIGLAPERKAVTQLQLMTTKLTRAKKHAAHHGRLAAAAKAVAMTQPTAANKQAAQKSMRDATDADRTVKKLQQKVEGLRIKVSSSSQHDALDQIKDTLAHYRQKAKVDDDKTAQREALVQSIAQAVKALHEIGGELPSETHVHTLQKDLRAAHARIAQLEGATKKKAHEKPVAPHSLESMMHSAKQQADHIHRSEEYTDLIGNAVKNALKVTRAGHV